MYLSFNFFPCFRWSTRTPTHSVPEVCISPWNLLCQPLRGGENATSNQPAEDTKPMGWSCCSDLYFKAGFQVTPHYAVIQPPVWLLKASCRNTVLLITKDFSFPGSFCSQLLPFSYSLLFCQSSWTSTSLFPEEQHFRPPDIPFLWNSLYTEVLIARHEFQRPFLYL